MDDFERHHAGIGWGPMLERYEIDHKAEQLSLMKVRYLCEVAPVIAKAAEIMGKIDALAVDDERPDVVPGYDWEDILSFLNEIELAYRDPKKARAQHDAYMAELDRRAAETHASYTALLGDLEELQAGLAAE